MHNNELKKVAFFSQKMIDVCQIGYFASRVFHESSCDWESSNSLSLSKQVLEEADDGRKPLKVADQIA